MLDDEPGEIPLSMEDLVVECEEQLGENTTLERKVVTTYKGEHESFCVGRKGRKSSVAKWFTSKAGKIWFPHLQF